MKYNRYLVVLLVQRVQQMLACKKMDQGKVLFLLLVIVGFVPRMAECQVEARAVQDYQGYQVSQEIQVVQDLLIDQVLHLVHLVHLVHWIHKNPLAWGFHRVAGCNFPEMFRHRSMN